MQINWKLAAGIIFLPAALLAQSTFGTILGTVTDSKVVFYQGDGIVVEEFAITGLDQIAAFDAGTFLLAAPAQ